MVNPLKDPANILSKRSVYFDYDQTVIKDEFKATIDAHAKYLRANRNARAIIQGNSDERGTREYNIALGQNRADAVKKLMLLLGASEAQVETVSFGKEKPRNSGHDDPVRRLRAVLDEHRSIADAIRERDAGRARAVMTRHIEQARDEIFERQRLN